MTASDVLYVAVVVGLAWPLVAALAALVWSVSVCTIKRSGRVRCPDTVPELIALCEGRPR